MRARLLNDGGFSGMPTEYPIEVEVNRYCQDHRVATINVDELVRIGADKNRFRDKGNYIFFVPREIEIIEDEE